MISNYEREIIDNYGVGMLATLRALIPHGDYSSEKNKFKIAWEKQCFELLGARRYNQSRVEKYPEQFAITGDEYWAEIGRHKAWFTNTTKR